MNGVFLNSYFLEFAYQCNASMVSSFPGSVHPAGVMLQANSSACVFLYFYFHFFIFVVKIALVVVVYLQ